MERLWILGAADPEMEAIEALLHECGERVAYALDDRGQRVHAGNAYRCMPLDHDLPADDQSHPETVYWVECDVDDAHSRVTDGPGLRRIDHHRPGDPGHGQPPAEFLPASSLGQMIVELAKLGRLPRSWHFSSPGPADRAGSLYYHGHRDAEAIGGEIRGCGPRVWQIEQAAECAGSACSLVGLVPRDLVLTAAADHCLGAAYHGECPGVDPDELVRWLTV